MKRTPLPPRTHPIPRSALKKRKRPAAKQAAKFAREYGSGERVNFVNLLPCIVVEFGRGGYCRGRMVNAHVGNEGAGTGRKANADQIAPMCDRHHRILDDVMGAGLFEEAYQLDLAACAAATEARWVEQGGAA